MEHTQETTAIIRELKLPVPEGYDRLAQVLFKALDQAASGKGKERHSSGEPFEDQPICVIARWVGVGGTLFQAIKKARESVRLLQLKGPEAAIFELYGAINFLAASIIVLEEMRPVIIKQELFCLTCFNKPCICKSKQFCFCGTELDDRGYCINHGLNTKVLPE